MKRVHGQCPLQKQGKINKQNNISEITWISLGSNHIIPDVLMWRGKAIYRPHFTDRQEPSGIEKRDMTITNNRNQYIGKTIFRKNH
jgi:hypothetical protein